MSAVATQRHDIVGELARPTLSALVPLLRRVRLVLSTPAEHAYIGAFRELSEWLSACLSGVGDLADLEARIDRAVESPKFFRFETEVTNALIVGGRLQELAKAPLDPPSREELGPFGGVLPYFEHGHVIEIAIARELARLLDAGLLLLPTHDELGSADGLATFRPAFDALHAPGMPAEVALAVFEGLRGEVALLALLHFVATGERPEPWVSRALAETWIKSRREYLRLLASLPGSCVVESLISAGERFNIDALERAAAQAASQIDARFREAERSAVPVFPAERSDSV